MYFSDEGAVEQAFHDASPARQPQLALNGFGYWHYGILLGIVALAAGIKKSIGEPYDPLAGCAASGWQTGSRSVIAGEVGFRRTFGISRNKLRLVAAGLSS